MKLSDTIYCKNVGTYSTQLTKRKSYTIEEVNDENVRVKNDENKLKWYSKQLFNIEKESTIQRINIDDEIKDKFHDLIEVTIYFDDGNKYWTTFTTPKYIENLLANTSYISATKMILVSCLTKTSIFEIIHQLDTQNELIDNCNIY